MPSVLPLRERRLLGAFAYAHDGSELAYERLREACEKYELPLEAPKPGPNEWTPRKRLSVIVDAWSFIDHISRARKVVTRFNWGTPGAPPEVQAFLDATKPATDIRNRLQHLDEDIFTGANCTEGHPILGSVSWVDARVPGGHTRFSVSSGPTIDAGKWAAFTADHVSDDLTVGKFKLMASDQKVDLEALRDTLAAFTDLLERSIRQSVERAVVAEAGVRSVPVEQLCRNGVTDMVTAIRLKPNGDGGFEWLTEQSHALVEVAPGVCKLN